MERAHQRQLRDEFSGMALVQRVKAQGGVEGRVDTSAMGTEPAVASVTQLAQQGQPLGFFLLWFPQRTPAVRAAWRPASTPVERLAPLLEDRRDKLSAEAPQPCQDDEDHRRKRLLLPSPLDESVDVGVQSLTAWGGNGLGVGLGLGICRGHEGVFRGKLMES
jgi:hypothetical protein